jgi:hypothetical protein
MTWAYVTATPAVRDDREPDAIALIALDVAAHVPLRAAVLASG